MSNTVQFPKIYDKYDQEFIKQQNNFFTSLICEFGVLALVQCISLLLAPLFPNKYQCIVFLY